MKIIQRKVLIGTYIPVIVKEIHAGYLNRPYFKDVYLYVAQNKLPFHKAAMRRTEILAEQYLLLDSLFKHNTTPGKESMVLAIPERCVDRIITLYHFSIFGGHQGVIKTYLTINENFFILDLTHYLRAFIERCHMYHLHRNEKLQCR